MSETVPRECPKCGRDRIVSRFEARRVFSSDAICNNRLDRQDAATHVCSYPACAATFETDNPGLRGDAE